MILRQPIDCFLMRTLLWLPPAFALWCLLAPVLLMPIVGWTHFVLTKGFGYLTRVGFFMSPVLAVVTRNHRWLSGALAKVQGNRDRWGAADD